MAINPVLYNQYQGQVPPVMVANQQMPQQQVVMPQYTLPVYNPLMVQMMMLQNGLAQQAQAQAQMQQQLQQMQPQLQQVQAQTQPQIQQPQQPQKPYSPMLLNRINKSNPEVAQVQQVGLTEAQRRVPGYKNNLRDMMTSNKANILAVVIRTMNAQDLDGNELIQGNEKSGNFINAVDRLDEIKNQGFTTLHVLPIHPTGKSNAMGTAGSLYAPERFIEKNGSLAIDPELVDENPPKEVWDRVAQLYEQKTGKKLTVMDKNDPEVAVAQCKYFVDECHKRGINLLLDLPSCASVDFAKEHPEMMAITADGKERVPQGWQDIRMFRPLENETTRELNKPLLDMHKLYDDACVEIGFDGTRADVGRAKPVEFWNVILNYSRAKDPQFAWLAETYTHEDASPQLNMPYDRPQELLEVGFDSYYGQYHIYNDWTQANQLYDYVRENIDMNNNIGAKVGPKSLIGSFATHDDVSPMLYGGAPWVIFTTTLQSMLPQVNPYMVDGAQTGDYYIYPYDHAIVKNSLTDNHECTVHTGRIDIFNKSRRPGGNDPEIANTVKAAFALRNNKYNESQTGTNVKLQMNNAQDVITKGSFIVLPSNNPEIVSFARHLDGKTLVFIGNRNVNKTVGGTIQIPGLKPDQKFENLMPKYGENCKFQNNKDGSVTVELGTSRACVFEIDDKDIEQLSDSKNIMKQEFVK